MRTPSHRASPTRRAAAPAIREAETLRTAVMHDGVFEDDWTIFIEARYGDEPPHSVGVHVDNTLGMVATEILLAGSIEHVEEILREDPPGHGEQRMVPIDPAEARDRIYAAMEMTDALPEAPVGEGYALLRALALLRADEIPGLPVMRGAPRPSPEEREHLLAEFLGSPEAEGIESGSDAAEAVSWAIYYCGEWVDGRPLRWSPTTVQLFMAWLPRTRLARRSVLEAVPDALPAWVRYAGRRRAIAQWAIDKTAEAVSLWTEEVFDAADPLLAEHVDEALAERFRE